MSRKFQIRDRRVKDLIRTFTANMVSLATGFITAFILPKFLNMEQYGYLRIFTFYITYVGIMHFGFNDGIYVKYGNYDYEDIPKDKFKAYFNILAKFQITIALIITIIALFFIKDINRKSVFVFIGINTFILNLNTFFDFINQFTRRFNIYAKVLSLSKIAYLILCITVLVFNLNSFMFLVVGQTFINLITFLFFLRTNKEVAGNVLAKNTIKFTEFKELILIGFFVMVGNLMSKLILGLDRMFVDYFFTLRDFAIYSFVISILNLFNVLFSAITTVVYPYLSRAKEEKRGQIYFRTKLVLFFLMGLAISIYYIFVPIINSFLPQYKESIPILLVLIPTVLISCQIIIVSFNFYKVMGYQKEFTINNIFALATGFITNVIFYYVMKSMMGIALASLLSFVIWMIFTDTFFTKKLNINLLKLNLCQLTLIASFIALGVIVNWYIGLLVYIIVYLIIIWVFYKKDLIELFKNKLNYLM